MEEELKKKVLNQLDNLILEVQKHPLYERYLFLSEKMKHHSSIQSLMSQIKEYQKKEVQNEAMGNQELSLEYHVKIKKLLKELESYPLYLNFIEVQQELDQVFQLIRYQLEDYFQQKLNMD